MSDISQEWSVGEKVKARMLGSSTWRMEAGQCEAKSSGSGRHIFSSAVCILDLLAMRWEELRTYLSDDLSALRGREGETEY
jgi:hypothetical protein